MEINGIRFNPASNYWGTPVKNKPVEIDVVAESQDGNCLLVGECKWQDKILDTQQLFSALEEKAMLLPFAKGKMIIPVLFLKNKPKNEHHRNVFLPEDVLSKKSW